MRLLPRSPYCLSSEGESRLAVASYFFCRLFTRPDGTSARVPRESGPVETTHPQEGNPTTRTRVRSTPCQPIDHDAALPDAASSMDRQTSELTLELVAARRGWSTTGQWRHSLVVWLTPRSDRPPRDPSMCDAGRPRVRSHLRRAKCRCGPGRTAPDLAELSAGRALRQPALFGRHAERPAPRCRGACRGAACHAPSRAPAWPGHAR